MNIDNAIEELASKGVPVDELRRLEESADQIALNLISLKMSGLNSENSLVKISRLLRKLALNLNIEFDHIDVLEKSAYPEIEAISSQDSTHTQKRPKYSDRDGNAEAKTKEGTYEAGN